MLQKIVAEILQYIKNLLKQSLFAKYSTIMTLVDDILLHELQVQVNKKQ